MGTRASIVIRDKDGDRALNLYKHNDGYPSGIADSLDLALASFRALPHADQSIDLFSAVMPDGRLFRPAVKPERQDLYKHLMESGDPSNSASFCLESTPLQQQDEPHSQGDVDFRYNIVQVKNGDVRVEVLVPALRLTKNNLGYYEELCSKQGDRVFVPVFEGNLNEFRDWGQDFFRDAMTNDGKDFEAVVLEASKIVQRD